MLPVLKGVPLDRSSRQIRLLSFLDPDTADAAHIRCRLGTYDLDNCPSFVALSYAWGNAHPLREIDLNGEVFPVCPNLYSALSVLWQDTGKQEVSHRGNLYWIDAICINQKDDSERGHQVNMMGAIYSEARSVFVWLGPGSAVSDMAIKILATYYDLQRETRDHEIHPSNSSISRKEKIREYADISGVMDNAYWDRMWVIQEFTLARDILLLRGRSMLSWTRLKFVVRSIKPRTSMKAMLRLVDGRIRREQGATFTSSETTLDSLISTFESSKCSDVRDKVYALLSLERTRSDDSSSPLYPDYTITPRQLYYRVLGKTRQSPTLRHPVEWDAFRADLRRILDVSDDDDFRRNDLLYQASEHERPDQKPLLSLHPDHRTRFGHTLLNDMARYLKWPLAAMERDPKVTYEEAIGFFKSFPKEEDPGAWTCFDTLIKEALGLRSTLREDSGMWNMFIEFLE